MQAHCATVWFGVETLKSPEQIQHCGTAKVEVATPDTSEHDNYGVYPAIDAAIGLAGLLNLMAATIRKAQWSSASYRKAA